MRNLLYLDADGQVVSLGPISSPPPSSSPSLYLHNANELLFSSIPVATSAFDIATLSFISGLLLLSLLSFSSIFYLRLRSRQFHHLENFNSLWTVRVLLVSFAFVWAVNEILRLPLIRRHYLNPFLPSITLQQQANICKAHVVLSLGFFEPSFLITLLFLVNVSIKKRKPSRMWALAWLLMVCFPMTTLLQICFVYFSPWEEEEMPKLMHGSFVLANDQFGNKMVLCTYPFFSCVIFGVFTIGYTMAFLLSCWRVTALVINKGMRHRIYMLASAVMVALSVQIACLILSWLWMPEEVEYGFVVLAMFLFVSGSMAVGEVVLVLKPIKDALALGGDLQRRPPENAEQSRSL